MLNKLRNFSKTKLATVLVGIIIIPFVFWGMGGVFQGGNTNNIAKIKNISISTQDFFEHINTIGVSEEVISKNIDKGILREILNDLLAKRFIQLEIEKLGIIINDMNLLELIKNNKNFLDDNKTFSRLKYEKFLLENNVSASEFEKRLKKRELEKILFNFYSAGLHTPKYLVDFYNYDKNRNIEIEYVSLENNYKKKSEFSKDEIMDYLDKNKEQFKRDFVDVKYAKLTPENLLGRADYDEEYYKKIDEIENNISNVDDLESLFKSYQEVEINEIKNLNEINIEKDLQGIFDYKNSDLIQILDKEDFFLVFKNKNYRKELPNLNDKFFGELKELLYQKNKFDYNQKLYSKIVDKKFNENDFRKHIADKSEYKTSKIKSIKDNNIFEINSVKLIYSMPIESFLIVADDNEKVYLLKILNTTNKKLKKDMKEYNKILLLTKDKIKNEIYSSYDQYLNNNYKVEINQNTLERTENYFK